MDRDRDPQGRPRNARPRDALGRPLPRELSQAADTTGAGLAEIPDRLAPDAAVRLADQMLRAGRPFHAHEALEAAWKSAPPAERDLWQGLAQIAVGITHARRGNARGAITLLRRGAERASRYRGHSYGIDVAEVTRQATELADRIESDGLAAASTALLTLTSQSTDQSHD